MSKLGAETTMKNLSCGDCGDYEPGWLVPFYF